MWQNRLMGLRRFGLLPFWSASVELSDAVRDESAKGTSESYRVWRCQLISLTTGDLPVFMKWDNPVNRADIPIGGSANLLRERRGS